MYHQEVYHLWGEDGGPGGVGGGVRGGHPKQPIQTLFLRILPRNNDQE